MTVGSHGGPLERLEQELDRPPLDVHHVHLASTGLSAMESLRLEVIVVAYPPNDLSSEEFFAGLDEALALLGNTKVVLLADERFLKQIEPHLDRRHLLLSPSWSPVLLRRYILSLVPTEMRCSPRLMLRLEVELGTGPKLWMCQTENISESGMLVRTNQLLLVGAEVRVAIMLPICEDPIKIKAEVVRHTNPKLETIRGVGLRFLELDGAERAALREYLDMQDDSLAAIHEPGI